MSDDGDESCCPGCGAPVDGRPAGPPGLERASCHGCALQLVRREGEAAWREIRG